MKNIIAIDVVLLPPREIWDWAVFLSQEINKNIKQKVILDKTHFPHITLLQIYVNRKDLRTFFDLVEAILQDYQPLTLNAQEIAVTMTSSGEQWISIKIEKTKELEKLHREIVNNLKKYGQKKNNDAFLTNKNETVNPFTLQLHWVENFVKQKYEKYFPHITLAISDQAPSRIKPREFIANRLAVCRLGNYCTCRKILREWKLS